MGSVFELYLANGEQPESGAYAELSLPATPYQMQDALDKVRLAEGDLLYWEVTAYRQFEELSAVLCGECGLHELNALAQRLEKLDDQQRTAFAGLVKMEQKKIPVSRLIDLAYSTDCCHVVDEALNDAQLGQFCAENGFCPGLDALPDPIFELLDFERIGREHRQREGGVLVERTADHPGGYVEQRDELVEAYKTLDLIPKAPDYTILLELEGGMELALPAEEPLPGGECLCLDCIVPALAGLTCTTAQAERMARTLDAMEPEHLNAYKALLDAIPCADMHSAALLADTPACYVVSPEIHSAAEAGWDNLSSLLGGDETELLRPYVDWDSYGRALIQGLGAVLTSYGLLERRDG